ncbi:MAG TPA: YdcF family protein [Roseiflexaceae bacterium]|nr:YdcF family protein [Roseiflexaceae bacterium]HMP39064.1 YdcF family protein [Roseiflexaceae bacterium]
MLNILRGVLRTLMMFAAGFLLIYIFSAIMIIIQAQREEARPAGAVIILGAESVGDTAPALQARLDHANELYRRGMVSLVILAAGDARGDPLAVAEQERQYLVDRGMPATSILVEAHGTTTYTSLQHAAELTRNNGFDSVLLVSDPYHAMRALKIARDIGLNAYGSPTVISPLRQGALEQARYVVYETGAYLMYLLSAR